MTLVKFQCPTCGAPLEDPGLGATMRCPYCTSSFLIPQELIQARTAAAAAQKAAASFDDDDEPPLVAKNGIFYQDDFSDPKSGWEIGKRSGGVSLSYVNSTYRIFLPEEDTLWEAYIDDDFSDFVAQVEVSRSAGPSDAEYGLLCRVTEDGGYIFWVNGKGEYGINKFYYGETDDDEYEYVDLGDGNTRVLQSGNAFNKIRAECVGQKLTLFLNERKVLEASDDEYESGDVGMLASVGESGSGGVDIRFKNLLVRVP